MSPIVAALPAAHLDLSAGVVETDRFLCWIGGSPQDGSGPLFRLCGRVFVPDGTRVEIETPPHGRDPGWMTLTYPADVRERYAARIAIQSEAEALAQGTGPRPTLEQARAAGMPEEWRLFLPGDALSGAMIAGTEDNHADWHRAGFVVRSEFGSWFCRGSYGEGPWQPGAPWGDWSRFRIVCQESAILLHPVQVWGLERWNGETQIWEGVRILGRGSAGGDWVKDGKECLNPCADSKDLGGLLPGFNPYGTQLPTGIYPVETRIAEEWIADRTEVTRSYRPSRYPQHPGSGDL